MQRQLGYAQTSGRAQRCAGEQPVRGRKNPLADGRIPRQPVLVQPHRNQLQPPCRFAEQPAPQRRTNHIPPAIHKIAVTIRHRHRTAIAGNLHDHRARPPRRTGPRPVPPAPRGRWPPTCGACPLTSASEYRPGPSSQAISVPKTVMNTRLSATPSTRRHGWQTGPRTSKNGCCVPPPRSTAPTKRSDGPSPCRARRCCAAGRDSPRSQRPRAGARRACW